LVRIWTNSVYYGQCMYVLYGWIGISWYRDHPNTILPVKHYVETNLFPLYS